MQDPVEINQDSYEWGGGLKGLLVTYPGENHPIKKGP